MESNWCKRYAWHDHSVEILLGIWEDNIDKLRAVKRNSNIYCDMKNKMIEKGVVCTTSDIANKIKNLSQRYRAEKRSRASGCLPSDWNWYNSIDRILTTGSPKHDENNDFLMGSTDNTNGEIYDYAIQHDEHNGVIPKKEISSTIDDQPAYPHHFSDIKCEVNPDVTSCDSNHSVPPLSQSYVPLPVAPVMKRPKLINIYEEMPGSKRYAWHDHSVEILLGIWADNIDKLRAAKRNSNIFLDMKNKMIENGVVCTTSDIANKIKNMSQRYRAEKRNRDSGGLSSDWIWYNPIDRIFKTGIPKHDEISDFSMGSMDNTNTETYSDYTTQHNKHNEKIPGKEITNSIDDPRTYTHYFSDIKCEVNPDASCDSNQSASSPSSSYAPAPVAPVRKRSKLINIYEEMLHEMKKIKKISEERINQEATFYKLNAEFMKQTLEKQEQTNKLVEHSNSLAKETLELQKLFLEAISQK